MIKILQACIVIIVLHFFATSLNAQVKINEVSPSNYSFYPDNDSSFTDWIELYNTGASAVNLLNYKLSDDPALLAKWNFPSVTIPAGGFLTVFASGKDRIDMINHWESLVKETDTWKYTVPASALPANWNQVSFNDAAWSQGPGGIGYGDGDDNTTVPVNTVSVYMRRKFNIIDSTAIKSMIFHMDYDDGFVAYLNGVEIARGNMPAGVPAYNTLASADREAVMYTGGLPSPFTINYAMFKTLLKNGQNVLSVEVHNFTSTSSDLSSRPFLEAGIVDASANYALVPAWFVAPASQTYLHTNFSIKGEGETVYLSNAAGTLIDQVLNPAIVAENTYGRVPNGSATLSLMYPTPNASNNSATTYSGYWLDSVAFSIPAGFYPNTQTLALSCSNAGSTLRYTIDGTKPNASSPIYSSPITINADKVVRAACFKPGYITKSYETNSYFIADATTLPVFSISTAPGNFFATDTGMYVMGPNAQGAYPHFGANFWMPWEREVHIEYFDKTGSYKFEQDAGITIHGGWSRGQSMKSMRIHPDSKYGKSKISYPLFSEKNIDEYGAVILRNAGNDFNYTHLRDAVNHRVIGPLGNVEYEAYEPVLVFINGVYWGVHTLRERNDTDFLKSNTGYSKHEVDLLEFDGTVTEGSNTDFLNMIDFVKNSDMTQAANYNTLQGMLDIKSCVDYFAGETYHTNWDWPHNNIRYWQPNKAGGKWRYIYHDTDFGESLFDFNTPTSNELNRFLTDTRSVHSPFMAKLLTNSQFKYYFINRYADLINTIYQPANFNGIFNTMKSQINPEMTRHFAKWNDNAGSVAGWNTECTKVNNFISARPANARNHIQSQFGLVKQVNVTINVSPAGAGKIMISTIVPGPLPWTGVYFDGCPVTITAYPNDGYSFDHWLSTVLITSPNLNKSVTLNISANDAFTAYFTTTTAIPKIAINEINYNSDSASNAGNWIELKNYGNATMDLSGWTFQDSKTYHAFVFPAGTMLGAGQYMVVCEDTVKFKAIHPATPFLKAQFGFNLSNDGETLKLIRPTGDLYLSFKYSDNYPWPLLADGKGGTLELLNVFADPNDPASWFNGCRNGSPGGPYIACPCLSPNLGPDKAMCSGSLTLNSGISTSARTSFKWYLNRTKITGATFPSITASTSGVYEVVVDSAGCVRTDDVRLVSSIAFNLGPDLTLCNPPTVTLDSKLNGYTGLSFAWQKNSVAIPGATSSSLLVKAAGTYSLSVTAPGCTATSDAVTVSSNIATPVDGSRCGTGTVSLSVTGPSTYKWYAAPSGGSSLFTGASYTTPSINTTTTYYAEDATYFNGTVGPASTAAVGGSIWTDNNWNANAYKMKFDVLQPLYLEAVTVFAAAPQNVTVRILKPDKVTVMFTKTVAVANAGQNRIPLSFQFTAANVANGYWMDLVGTTGMLDYNGSGAVTAFPYNSSTAGYMRITEANASWGAQNAWYFYLYNWEYASAPGGQCARVPVTATVNPTLGSVGSVSGNFSVCAGSVQTYSVAPLAGATSYTWAVPAGSAVTAGAGTSSITVNVGSTSGNMTVVPVNSCGNGSTTTQALTVNSAVAPTVTITLTAGSNPSCSGSNVTFTAGNTNPGAAPSYQWKNNGTAIPGATTASYSSSSLSNGNIISCAMTSSLACASPASVSSNTITMTVNSPVTPALSISITSGTNPACAGSSVTFTASPTYPGASPSYQWNKNGTAIPSATAATYTSSSLSNGDVITCTMVSNAACATVSSVTSSGITMTINSIVVPSVVNSITAGNNPSCSGASVTFTATPTYGGSAPAYVWKKNGTVIAGATAATYTSAALVTSDAISVTMTSNQACASPLTANSNSISMTVNSVVAPTVSISVTTGSNPTCSGNIVGFTAAGTNKGTSPTYQWNKNANPIGGATASTYSTSGISNGDVFTCTMTSNSSCASPATVTSSGITMTVNSNVVPTLNISISSGTNPSCAGSAVSFTTSGTFLGGSPAYQWKNNGSPIAGATSSSYSSSTLANGNVISCTVTSSQACATPATASSSGITMTVKSAPVANAGPAQSLCASSATLAAVPSGVPGETYLWSVLSGTGSFSNTADPNAVVSGLSTGLNQMRWTVNNGVCPSQSATVDINVSVIPSVSSAGPDQYITGTVTTLGGNNPSVGSGTWSFVSGNGFISNPSVNNSAVGGLASGSNILRWTIQNGACPPSADDVLISVGIAPSLGGGISGPANVQAGQTYTYTVPADPSSTFNWTIPPGATIGGQGSNTVTITFGPTGGTVGVTATNPYGSDSGNKTITVGQGPVISGIAGPDSVADNSPGIVYSIPADPDPSAVYSWTVPSGAAITSGAGTNSITVTFGNSGGNVAVSLSNSFGSDAASKLVITGPAPSSPSITGPANVNNNDTYTYSVPYVPGMNYTWSVPAGASIGGNPNGSSITVTFGPSAVSGNVSVTEQNGFGNTSANLPVTVNATSTAVVVQNSDFSMNVYPSPFEQDLTVRVNSASTQRITVRMDDVSGVNVYFNENDFYSNEDIKIGSVLKPGFYILQLSIGGTTRIMKVVKL